MCRRYPFHRTTVFVLSSLLCALLILSAPAVQAGGYPVITELQPLMNSSSSSGEFVLEDGSIAGRSYGRAVTWGPSGKVRDLGTFGGDNSGVESVSAAGILVGQAQDGSGQYMPVMWYANGKMVPVPVNSTGYSSAWAVNNSGEVVGTYRSGNDNQAFYWGGSGPVTTLGDLGSPGAWGWDINDLGTVVGEAHIENGELYPPAHAFKWTPVEGMTDLGAMEPGGWSSATYINNKGEIAGGIRESGGVSRAAFWAADGTLVEIGPGHDIYSYPVGLNENGQVALGAYTSPGGYIWSEDMGLVSLGSLGGIITRPQAINEQGQVVGWSRTEAGDMHAFLWTMEDGMVDLGTLGGTRSAAYGINENGIITGWSDVDPDKYPTYPWITRAVKWDMGTGGVGGGGGECPDLEQILAAVDNLDLNKGLANSLYAKLEAAGNSLGRNNIGSASGQLEAFIHQVEAKSGKGIAPGDADILTGLTLDLLDCLEGN